MAERNIAARSVLVTGASSGIGEALAVACAMRGAESLFLCGRDVRRLEDVVRRCREHAPRVEGRAVDVTDARAMREWLLECDGSSPLELVFANAGVSTGVESEENVRRTFATNVGGCLNTVLPAIEAFRRRGSAAKGRRQVVLTSSMAGYAPLPACPSYAGTKAAVKAWGLSLRGALKREGIMVNVVCPGFVRSRITDRNTCPMPFFMEADRAARTILDRVDRNVGLIAFPWQMRLATWLLSALPWRLAERLSSGLPGKTREEGPADLV